MSLYDLARPALFALDAERAHALTMGALSRLPMLGGVLAGKRVEDPVELMGLKFRNRIGLAAGLDKNGEAIEAFEEMGFGFIEIGTVTPRPQPGNPRPRMWRLPRQHALINRLGFNNHGVDALVERAGKARRKAVLGINIGKNADTPLDLAEFDYLACMHKVWPVADYITVNISSPNTAGLRDLQQTQRFDGLMAKLAEAREALCEQHGVRRPLLIKIAPDIDDLQAVEFVSAAKRHGIDGLIATNTTIDRPGVDHEPAAVQAGGLSGGPLRTRADAVLKQLREMAGPDFPLIGVGGVLSGGDAAVKRLAGADLVQIYTGLIYRGPGLVAECARDIRDARRSGAVI